MKRIYANTPGTFPAPTPEGRTIKVREHHGCGDDVVTEATRQHEQRAAVLVHKMRGIYPWWTRIVRNRIAWNHDARARDGIQHDLIRAELWHAVY